MRLEAIHLRHIRRLLVEEINHVNQWARMPDAHDRGSAVEKVAELEEALDKIDLQLEVEIDYLRKQKDNEKGADSAERGPGLDDLPV